MVASSEGHRDRLRQRFLRSGLDGFLDYEIVELLLILGTPRRDCKASAKAAILKFKGLVGVLNASAEELQTITGIGPSNVLCLLLYKELSRRYYQEKVKPGDLLDSPRVVYEYLREAIGSAKKEKFVVLFLDTRSQLIFDEVSIGTINASLVHPREVFKNAILNNASHVLIAHNHPSGDVTPSEQDIVTTKRLVEIGKLVGIAVVDHIIVSSTQFISLKNQGLMRE